MNPSFPTDLGATLSQLRNETGRKQIDIARHLKVDASRVSRIENGDFSPTMAEVSSYLQAVGTESAQSYLNYLEQDWRILTRPPFSHPDRHALWGAEHALQRLDVFVGRPEISRTLRGQAELYRHTLERSAAYLFEREHTIAYIGDIGVGKTSFLCTQIGLTLPETDKGGLQSRMVLEAGGGGTTICEVRVSQRPNFGIKVEPMEDQEVYRLATEFCAGIRARSQGTATQSEGGDDSEQEIGVSREMERALRNMAGLNRTREKTPEGKTRQVDPAMALAQEFNTLDTFRAEVQQRLGLWNRTRREIWFEGESEAEGLAWLKATFTQINNGRHPDFTLPERMHVMVRQPILPGSDYQLEVVDTKGVDKIAVRPDLQHFAADPRTITVLCSKFNSAPDVSLQGFLKHLQEMGIEQALQERTILLVLPRPEEAMAMKDDAGNPVETAEEGYEIKQEQVAMKLPSLAAGQVPIYFSNIGADDPADFSMALLNQIIRLRAAQAQQITSLTTAVEDLIANEEREHAQLALKHVTSQINLFATNYPSVPGRVGRIHQALLSAVNMANARAVWASTRRSGSWGNLNVYYHLGIGATSDARRRTETIFTELQGLLKQMSTDSELAPAHSFIEALQANVSGWRTAFLEAVRHAGELSFRPTLEDDSGFWWRCTDMYGRGLPYRNRVVEEFSNWFDHSDRQALYDAFEARVQTAWRQEVIKPMLEASQQEPEDAVEE